MRIDVSFEDLQIPALTTLMEMFAEQAHILPDGRITVDHDCYAIPGEGEWKNIYAVHRKNGEKSHSEGYFTPEHMKQRLILYAAEDSLTRQDLAQAFIQAVLNEAPLETLISEFETDTSLDAQNLPGQDVP